MHSFSPVPYTLPVENMRAISKTGREHMRDQHEQDAWDQDEVEIEDLGAPDRGLSRYFFTLGEKWHTAGPLRARFVTLLVALCLLIAVLQSGSSGVNNQASGAPRVIPRPPLHSTIDIIECAITIDISSSSGQPFTWQKLVSTPSAQECSFSISPGSQCPMPQQLLPTPTTGQGWIIACSNGTPSPVSAGKNGKDR